MSFNTILYMDGSPNGVEKVLGFTEYNGTSPLFGWGLSRLRIVKQSLEIDTCEFKQDAANVDSTPVFAFEKIIQVFQHRIVDITSPTGFSGGKRLFYGMVRETPASASGSQEDLSYRAVGPGWWLENQTYEVAYFVFDGYNVDGEPASGIKTEVQYTSHLFLNRGVNLTNQNVMMWLCTGEQMQKAVEFAISYGAPIQLLGNVDVALNPGDAGLPSKRTVPISSGIQTFVDIPTDEVMDLTGAEVIKKQVRWSPDAVTWFDYSTAPFPTFRCARKQYLNSVSINVLGGTFEHTQVSPRYDILKNYVQLTFEAQNEIDGQTWPSFVVQTWPSPLGGLANTFGGLVASVRLQGINLKTSSVAVKTLPIPDTSQPDTTGQHALLTAFNPFLLDSTIIGFVINAVSRSLNSGLNFYLVPGSAQLTDWIPNGSGNPVSFANDSLVFEVTITALNGKIENRVLTVPIMSCDLNTKGQVVTYTKQVGVPFQELPPSGLAEALYIAHNTLQYSGELSWIGSDGECDTDTLDMGDTVNYSDIPAFAAMNAIIQRVVYDIDEGRTSVSFGPSKLLTAGDYIELLRITRFRLVLNDPSATQNANFQQQGGNVSVGDVSPVGMPTMGAGWTPYHVTSDKNDATGGNVSIDAQGLFGQPGAPPGPAIVVAKGAGLGDKTIAIQWSDLQDVTAVDSDGFKARFRWLQVCVTNTDGSTTVMKAKVFATMPQPL